MKYLKMKITASLLAAACLTGMAMPVAEAATTWQKILYGAAAIALISNYYSILTITMVCSSFPSASSRPVSTNRPKRTTGYRKYTETW